MDENIFEEYSDEQFMAELDRFIEENLVEEPDEVPEEPYELGEKEMAETGNAAAQYELGKQFSHSTLHKAYHLKLGVNPDRRYADNDIARKWFQKAAEQNFPKAFSGWFHLEFDKLHQKAKSTWSSCDLGRKMFDLASKGVELGDTQAKQDLACCYQCGIGVSKDIAKAIVWYNAAASEGDKISAFRLVMIVAKEKKLKVDDETAIKWFDRAMELDIVMSYNLIQKFNSLRQTRLFDLEAKLDEAGFEKYAFSFPYRKYSAEEVENELAILFAPYTNWANSKDILLENNDTDKEAAYLPPSIKIIFENLKEIQDNITEIVEDNKFVTPELYRITVEDLFPFPKNEVIKKINSNITRVWFFVKKNYSAHYENISFLEDEEILDSAENEDKRTLTLTLVSIVEIKLEMEAMLIEFFEIFQDLIHFRENPNDRAVIKKIAGRFMNGNDYIPRSYSIANEWYSKIPDDEEAKENLAKINAILL